MRVVKLGGSLIDWEGLPQCLRALVDRNIAIVPGGGPFADQVRRAQTRWQFDDATAHAMALLAMNQFGRLLAGVESRLRTADGVDELRRKTAGGGRAVVWLPRIDDLALERWSHNWDVTSDSLAIWLADQLGASEVLLVKSVQWPGERPTWAQLAEHGVVDRAFAKLATAATCTVRICYRGDYPRWATVEAGSDLTRIPRPKRRPAAASPVIPAHGHAELDA